MDPHVSCLVDPITEYSAKQGSSSFSEEHWPGMDTARILLTLKQGSRSLEIYIRGFLAIANYSDLPDCLLIEFFCDGINQPLQSEFRREGPRSSLAQFMDYALLTVGSLLTVGVAEEERGTAFMTEIAATLEHAHKMAATADPVHKWRPQQHPFMSLLPVMSQVKSQPMLKSQAKSQLMLRGQGKLQPLLKSQVKSQLMLTSQAKPQLIFASQSKPQLIFVSQAKPQLIVMNQPISQLTSQSHTTSQLTSQSHTTSQLTSQSLFTSQLFSQSLFTSQLFSQSLFTSQLFSQSHTRRFKVSPSSSLSGVQREGCTAGVCTRIWYPQIHSL